MRSWYVMIFAAALVSMGTTARAEVDAVKQEGEEDGTKKLRAARDLFDVFSKKVGLKKEGEGGGAAANDKNYWRRFMQGTGSVPTAEMTDGPGEMEGGLGEPDDTAPVEEGEEPEVIEELKKGGKDKAPKASKTKGGNKAPKMEGGNKAPKMKGGNKAPKTKGAAKGGKGKKSVAPSKSPSVAPSDSPSKSPAPTAVPSESPSDAPSKSPAPTAVPSESPSDAPSKSPAPTADPSESPSDAPTNKAVSGQGNKAPKTKGGNKAPKMKGGNKAPKTKGGNKAPKMKRR